MLTPQQQQAEESDRQREREAKWREMFEEDEESAPPPASVADDKSVSAKGSLEKGESDARRETGATASGEGMEVDDHNPNFELQIFPEFALDAPSDSDLKNQNQLEICGGDGDSAGGSSYLDGLISKVMQNPDIMDRFFKVCPRDLLPDCRMVCTYWHDKLHPRWRASAWVHLSTWDKLERFVEFLKDKKNDCVKNPYRKFHLVEGLDWSDRDDLRPLSFVEEMWQLCGEYITGLRLERWRNFSLQKLLYDCPKLKTLELGYETSFSSDNVPRGGLFLHLTSLTLDMNAKPLPIPWKRILSPLPELTTIKLIRMDSEETLEKILRAVQLIRQRDPNKLRLKHLDLLGAFPNSLRVIPLQVRTLLLELQLPLETLALDFGSDTKRETVKELLEAHAETLRSLVAYRDPLSGTRYFNFPFGVNLDRLEELCLPDNFTDSLEFFGGMPNLRKLHVGNAVQDRPMYKESQIVARTRDAPLAGVELQNLTELRLDYAVGVEDLRRLVRWIPNLRRLRMFLNDQQFGIVCGGWRKLEHLQVFGNELTYEGVTGRKMFLEVEEVEQVASCPRPNITWLKWLTSFTMDNDLVSPTYLTDVSVFEALLQMKSLQCLKLCARISDDGFVALMTKIPDCEIVQMVWDQDEQRWFKINHTFQEWLGSKR